MAKAITRAIITLTFKLFFLVQMRLIVYLWGYWLIHLNCNIIKHKYLEKIVNIGEGIVAFYIISHVYLHPK